MGVVFFIGFLMVVLVGGLLCLGLGIGGMIASVITRKKGKRENGKKIAIPSAILLILGTAVLLLPVGYLGFIYAVNTLPPDDYVKTDIIIEEDGYQSERFTADGVVYTVLPLASGQIEKKNPLFSYETSGFMNGSQKGNYYAVENGGGFQLVHDGCGNLFCPTDQAEAVLSYYSFHSAQKQFCGELWVDAKSVALAPFEQDLQEKLFWLQENYTSLSFKPLLLEESEKTVFCTLVSKDGVVAYKHYWIELYENEGYLTTKSAPKGDGKIEYTAVALDEELFALLQDAIAQRQ